LTGLVILLLGVVTVVGTSLLKNVEWSDKTKNLIALGLSVLGGGVYVLQQEGWDVSAFASVDLLEMVTMVYGASQALYGFVLNGTGFNTTLENSLVTPSGDE